MNSASFEVLAGTTVVKHTFQPPLTAVNHRQPEIVSQPTCHAFHGTCQQWQPKASRVPITHCRPPVTSPVWVWAGGSTTASQFPHGTIVRCPVSCPLCDLLLSIEVCLSRRPTPVSALASHDAVPKAVKVGGCSPHLMRNTGPGEFGIAKCDTPSARDHLPVISGCVHRPIASGAWPHFGVPNSCSAVSPSAMHLFDALFVTRRQREHSAASKRFSHMNTGARPVVLGGRSAEDNDGDARGTQRIGAVGLNCAHVGGGLWLEQLLRRDIMQDLNGPGISLTCWALAKVDMPHPELREALATRVTDDRMIRPLSARDMANTVRVFTGAWTPTHEWRIPSVKR